jgi:hypothetical protein
VDMTCQSRLALSRFSVQCRKPRSRKSNA